MATPAMDTPSNESLYNKLYGLQVPSLKTKRSKLQISSNTYREKKFMVNLFNYQFLYGKRNIDMYFLLFFKPRRN